MKHFICYNNATLSCFWANKLMTMMMMMNVSGMRHFLGL